MTEISKIIDEEIEAQLKARKKTYSERTIEDSEWAKHDYAIELLNHLKPRLEDAVEKMTGDYFTVEDLQQKLADKDDQFAQAKMIIDDIKRVTRCESNDGVEIIESVEELRSKIEELEAMIPWYDTGFKEANALWKKRIGQKIDEKIEYLQKLLDCYTNDVFKSFIDGWRDEQEVLRKLKKSLLENGSSKSERGNEVGSGIGLPSLSDEKFDSQRLPDDEKPDGSAEKEEKDSFKKESACIGESLEMNNATPEMEISEQSDKNRGCNRHAKHVLCFLPKPSRPRKKAG